ncbi:MAG: DNA recombination protein RmuC, partial [Coriobacteriales bacterium]|nr:DNA recombination protein RmuC [Coriobacteriales bacterium]
KRSSEIEQLLGAVKTEFEKFQVILDNVDKRLEQARSEIGKATRKSGTIRRRLKKVTELPSAESVLLLGTGEAVDEDSDDEVEEDGRDSKAGISEEDNVDEGGEDGVGDVDDNGVGDVDDNEVGDVDDNGVVDVDDNNVD